MKTTDSDLSNGQANCLQAEVKNQDDIVFEKRNKNYGAYYLRRSYYNNVTRALTISVLAILLATIIPFIVFKQAHSGNINNYVATEAVDLIKTVNDVTPPLPPPPPVEALEKRVRFTVPIITIDSVEDTHMFQDSLNLNGSNPGLDTSGGGVIILPVPPKVIQLPTPIYISVAEPPSFEGGIDKLYKWLGENIKYPIEAREAGISGTVVVTFVVEKDGSITNVEPLNKIGGGCEQEAVRVVKLMPKWRGGKQNNMEVRVQFNLPIKFSLE